jgi:DNA-binding response OmpR family regulator
MNASLSDGNETVIDLFILSANSPLSSQLEKQLKDEGYYVTLFSDGTHLLETLRNGKPNLLMCDTTVPDADAFEVCRQIKADDYLWNIPVLIITGASDLGDLLRVLDCNADNFIAHPFDSPYLLSLIEGMLTVPVERQTSEQIKTQFKIKHDNQVFVVTADRRKLLEFLLSSFEIAVNKSTDLFRAQENIRNLGLTTKKLEENIHENTRVINIINETLKTKEQKLAELTVQLSDREQTVREKIAALDQVSRDLAEEKSTHANARSEIQRIEKERDEALAAHQTTIDGLQRQMFDLSSELATVKPALERANVELVKESSRQRETETELRTTVTLKEQAEKALLALTTEFEQLKINLGAERNRVQEAEQELNAVLQAKTQSEQDLTGIINDLKATAKEQAAAITRIREESESECARISEESESERARLGEELESERARFEKELESEQTLLRQTEENLNSVTAAKEQSEASLQATIDARQKYLLDLQAWLDTAKHQLEENEKAVNALHDEMAAAISARDSAEQELASVSRTLAETNAALEAETRDIATQKEDLARVYEEKEKAESLAETLSGSLKELQDQREEEMNRHRENEERLNVLILQRDQELGELRGVHEDARTTLSSQNTTLEQIKKDLDTAVSARMEIEGNLQSAEEKIRQMGRDLENASGGRAEEKQQLATLSDDLERTKNNLEQELLRRQEAEDQLRDALSQQQQLEQDLERLVSETKTLHADLSAERRLHDAAEKQTRSLEEQIASLSREKHEAEQTAANLTAEIDQARVALADEWEDHMTDKERFAAIAEKKQPPRPAPFPGVRREAEIIKKRSLIVKGPNIPSEIRPLPRSMVAIDPVKSSEPGISHISSVEDLFEDDDNDREDPAGKPVVSIINEPASKPVQDVLPDGIPGISGDHDGFFDDTGLSVPESEDTIGEDETNDVAGDTDSGDAAPVSGQNIAFSRTQWLDLLKWSHHCDALEPDQRMQIVRMGRLIQKGRKLTRKQEEQVLEMVALVQRLGYHFS